MARKRPQSDGGFPDCSKCLKLRLPCRRPIEDLQFIISTSQPSSYQHRNHHPSVVSVSENRQTPELATQLALLPPREALQNPDIAYIFNHYIHTLAPWYDLNDAGSVFGTVVPVCALDVPVLFRAASAFSCAHWFKMTGKLGEIAFAFHAACVEDLLRNLGGFSEFPGEYLAAACLLRSYEILNENMLSPQCHLLGAYSLSTAIDLELSSWGLPQAGFWNYLREEITVGLACRRPVRIGRDFVRFRDVVVQPTGIGDDMRANLVTYTLACAMNVYFSSSDDICEPGNWPIERLTQWKMLQEDLALWRQSLPSTFEPFSRACSTNDTFPSCWMLRPWHVCALQYASITEMLLILSSPRPDDTPLAINRVQELALHVCGLAFTNESVAARVNAFGPLSFCGRYLTQDSHRSALEARLTDFHRLIGWPVRNLIADLKECWAR